MYYMIFEQIKTRNKHLDTITHINYYKCKLEIIWGEILADFSDTKVNVVRFDKYL